MIQLSKRLYYIHFLVMEAVAILMVFFSDLIIIGKLFYGTVVINKLLAEYQFYILVLLNMLFVYFFKITHKIYYSSQEIMIGRKVYPWSNVDFIFVFPFFFRACWIVYRNENNKKRLAFTMVEYALSSIRAAAFVQTYKAYKKKTSALSS